MKDARILVNGKSLTENQEMALRAAYERLLVRNPDASVRSVEPQTTIGGHVLTVGESMCIRNAVEASISEQGATSNNAYSRELLLLSLLLAEDPAKSC